MKLYHYITKGNSALSEGILSFANNPKADISSYEKRSGASNRKAIIEWMESSFEGRSRGICGFSEPIKWTENSRSLKKFIDNSDIFSIDLQALEKDGLIDAVYSSPAGVVDNISEIQYGTDEVLDKPPSLDKLSSINDIDYSSIDWNKCNDKLGLYFHVVPYYVLIVKGGILLPKYLTKEN